MRGCRGQVEGRNIYLTSPEYMASFARKFVKAGATLVGGCCGTTPSHMRAMKSALRAMEAQDARRDGRREVTERRRCRLRRAREAEQGGAAAAGGAIEDWRVIAQRASLCTMVEIVPPKGIDCSKEIDGRGDACIGWAWTRSMCRIRRGPVHG